MKFKKKQQFSNKMGKGQRQAIHIEETQMTSANESQQLSKK